MNEGSTLTTLETELLNLRERKNQLQEEIGRIEIQLEFAVNKSATMGPKQMEWYRRASHAKRTKEVDLEAVREEIRLLIYRIKNMRKRATLIRDGFIISAKQRLTKEVLDTLWSEAKTWYEDGGVTSA